MAYVRGARVYVFVSMFSTLIIWLNQFSFRQLFLSADENLFQGALRRTIETIFHRPPARAQVSEILVLSIFKYWKTIRFELAFSGPFVGKKSSAP